MARTLTPKDCYAIMNALVAEATGQQSTIQAVDPSSFVAAGEAVLATGTENVLNSLGLVLGRRYMAVRPYNAPLSLINSINTDVFTHVFSKVSFYSRNALPSGAMNTDLFTNLAEGFTAGENIDGNGDAQSTKSQWEQHLPVVAERYFGGSSTWQDCNTIPEIQLQQAFRSESDFAAFLSGIMTEKANDIESQKEAFNRMVLLNHIAAVYDMSANMPGSVVNLTSAFNTKFGTSYTSAQLRSTYLKEFLEFFTAQVKLDSDRMTNRSLKNHWSPAKTVGGTSYVLLRHTPKDKQKLFLYRPLFVEAQSYVFPEIFNPQYLKIENYEGIDYWQNELPANAPKIDVAPAIPNVASPSSGQTKGDRVQLDFVVGMLFDEDALMVDYQLERATSTPVEARKFYRNLWYTFQRNAISDTTENAILYYMADPAIGG